MSEETLTATVAGFINGVSTLVFTYSGFNEGAYIIAGIVFVATFGLVRLALSE